MDSDTQQRLRAELETARDDLVAELRELGADPESAKVRDLDTVDDNFADSASAATERSEKLTLIAQANERLADTEHALERMDDGSYGTCERCGEQISYSRLQARPMSVLCVDCAEEAAVS
ncbi:RNA polymerase-binding protein DksA [soil metagenome]